MTSKKRVSQTVIAYCVLHNICVENTDEWEELANEPYRSELDVRSNNRFDDEELREKLKDFINKTT